MNEAQPMNGRLRQPARMATFDDVNEAARLLATVTAQKLSGATQRLAAVEGHARAIGQQLAQLVQQDAQDAERLADIEGRVIGMQGDVDRIDAKLDRIAAIDAKADRITAIEQKLDRLRAVEEKLDRLLELLKAAAAAPIKGDT